MQIDINALIAVALPIGGALVALLIRKLIPAKKSAEDITFAIADRLQAEVAGLREQIVALEMKIRSEREECDRQLQDMERRVTDMALLVAKLLRQISG